MQLIVQQCCERIDRTRGVACNQLLSLIHCTRSVYGVCVCSVCMSVSVCACVHLYMCICAVTANVSFLHSVQ